MAPQRSVTPCLVFGLRNLEFITVEGTDRVAQRVADEPATGVGRGMHMAATATVAELPEGPLVDLEHQDREPSTMVRCRSAIDVRKVGDPDGPRILALTGGWVR